MVERHQERLLTPNLMSWRFQSRLSVCVDIGSGRLGAGKPQGIRRPYSMFAYTVLSVIWVVDFDLKDLSLVAPTYQSY